MHRERVLLAGLVVGDRGAVDVHAERVRLGEARRGELRRARARDVRAEVAMREAEADARDNEERRERLCGRCVSLDAQRQR